jgi:hypothetical protein
MKMLTKPKKIKIFSKKKFASYKKYFYPQINPTATFVGKGSFFLDLHDKPMTRETPGKYFFFRHWSTTFLSKSWRLKFSHRNFSWIKANAKYFYEKTSTLATLWSTAPLRWEMQKLMERKKTFTLWRNKWFINSYLRHQFKYPNMKKNFFKYLSHKKFIFSELSGKGISYPTRQSHNLLRSARSKQPFFTRNKKFLTSTPFSNQEALSQNKHDAFSFQKLNARVRWKGVHSTVVKIKKNKTSKIEFFFSRKSKKKRFFSENFFSINNKNRERLRGFRSKTAKTRFFDERLKKFRNPTERRRMYAKVLQEWENLRKKKLIEYLKQNCNVLFST